ncbi:MAG: hypothetical protein ACJA1C_000964 [Crocinitomicaceae bacterium]|jgi:hypothetical protein
MGLGKKIERPNAAVQRSNDPLVKPSVQAKLKMGSAGDKHEQQADRVADGVVQKMGKEEEPVQMKAQEEEAPIQKMEEESIQKMEEEEPVQKMEEEPVQKKDKEEDPM